MFLFSAVAHPWPAQSWWAWLQHPVHYSLFSLISCEHFLLSSFLIDFGSFSCPYLFKTCLPKFLDKNAIIRVFFNEFRLQHWSSIFLLLRSMPLIDKLQIDTNAWRYLKLTESKTCIYHLLRTRGCLFTLQEASSKKVYFSVTKNLVTAHTKNTARSRVFFLKWCATHSFQFKFLVLLSCVSASIIH